MIVVDVRGFSCPIPVVKAKEAMKEYPNEELIVTVDTAVAKENVTRLARSERYSVEVESIGDEFHLRLIPSSSLY